jgi:hypothetical protein
VSIVRGQKSTLASAASGASLATSWGTNPVAGSTVLIFVQYNVVPTSVVDNGTTPSTFTLDKSTTAGKGAHVYRANNISLPSAGAYSVTASLPSSTQAISIMGIAYTGVVPGAPRATNNGGATGTAVTTNAATGDFHLLPGSPALGAGDPAYTPTFDFAGNPRSQADLGVYAG